MQLRLSDLQALFGIQISGVKVYRAENQTNDEVILECDFMWAGQQVQLLFFM